MAAVMTRALGWFAYLIAALCVFCMLCAPKAESHESSTSYLKLDAKTDGSLDGSFDVGVLDLSFSVPLDADGDGRVLWREVEAAQPAIAALIAGKLIVERGGRQCTFHVTDVLVTRHVGEPYLSLPFAGRCEAVGLLRIRSDLFFSEDSGHRTLFDVRTASETAAGFLMESAREWKQSQAPQPWTTFAAFVVQGIWHVWTGYDHLAFLLSLLLPCALTAGLGAWRPAEGLKVVLRDLLRIITAFTVAHSITLGLATLHVVSFRARIIEPMIAATIIIAALLNLFPRAVRLRLPLAFSFGLIHGFGFALALSELAPVRGQIVALLAGFNIGVELAQLSVVLLVAPVLVLLRQSAVYATRLMPAASVAVAAAGFIWLGARLG
jgi:HupE / UreJ protein